jgi:hypothetical protein
MTTPSKQIRWQRRHVAAGLCYNCSKPATHGKRCDLHYQRNQQSKRKAPKEA